MTKIAWARQIYTFRIDSIYLGDLCLMGIRVLHYVSYSYTLYWDQICSWEIPGV